MTARRPVQEDVGDKKAEGREAIRGLIKSRMPFLMPSVKTRGVVPASGLVQKLGRGQDGLGQA